MSPRQLKQLAKKLTNACNTVEERRFTGCYETQSHAVTVGQYLLQPRSGGIGKARHGSAGRSEVGLTESASADDTSFVTASSEPRKARKTSAGFSPGGRISSPSEFFRNI